jgi:guanine deaminase
MRFGSGLAQIRSLLDRGVNVGLATDGTNSSDSLNMFEAMRAGSSISRIVTADFERWLGTAEMLHMATEGSARAMGFKGRIGRIEPGYCADLVFLDLGHINYVPLGNLARQIVFAENAAAVDSVMIDGRMVLDHGQITTLDEAKLRRDANAAADRLFNQNAPIRALSKRLEPLVGRFCQSIACQPYHVHRLACEPVDASQA